jgi:prolipoprotein diacylglyceryltransferase
MAPVLVQEHAALVHGLCVAAGIAAGAAVLALEVRRRGAADERLLVVVAGVVVGGALGMRDRLADPADLLVGYLTAYALFRLWVETTRTNDVLAVGLTGSQWVVLLALPLLLARCTRIRLARRQLRETQEPRHHGAVA